MAIQIQGNGGTVAEVDGTSYRAQRITQRPIDAGTLGHYKLAVNVALVAAQAVNGTLFSFRWADATRLCALQFVRLRCLQTAAATATIMPNFEVVQARSFSASDSAGTSILPTLNNAKRRTSMGATLLTDLRISALAAGVTAGTRTLDAQPVMILPTSQTITTPNATIHESLFDSTDGDHPLIFAANEGFIVRGPTVAFGAAGTANLIVNIGWVELAAF